MSDEILSTTDASFRRFCKILENMGFIILDVSKHGFHRLIKAKMINEQYFYFMYKKDLYNSFKDEYGENSKGETINVDNLWFCLDHQIRHIVICYPDGKLYGITPTKWLEYANEHNTYRKIEKPLIRREYGKEIKEVETVANIDVRELARLDIESI